LGGYNQPNAYQQTSGAQQAGGYQQPAYGQPMGAYSPPPANDGVVGGALSDGWAAFKQNAGLYIGMFLVYMVIYGVMAGITSGIGSVFNIGGEQLASSKSAGVLAFVGLWVFSSNLIVGIISMALMTGYQMAAVKAMRGGQPEFTDLFSTFPYLIPLGIAWTLYMLAILGGMVLLIVPGVIIALGFSQFALLVIDRKLPAIEALKTSWAIMRGYKAWFIVLGLALVGINLLGLLALLVGLIVTVPLSSVIQAAFYKRVLDAYERANGPIGGAQPQAAAYPQSGYPG
jgi:uncharacterized membrane protein